MSDIILVRFIRKPLDAKEVMREAKSDFYDTFEVKIAETVQLTTVEYDNFAADLLEDRDWLAGKGGFKNNIRQVIAVTAPERQTLYVDPSGHAYGRYVGLRIDNKAEVA